MYKKTLRSLGKEVNRVTLVKYGRKKEVSDGNQRSII